MTTDYKERLRIPLEGNYHTRFETKTGLRVAPGYTRIVIGGRGPYVEFEEKHLVMESLHLTDRKHRYFTEWRTNDDADLMVYQQREPVDYADYRIGLFYIKPFDLFVEGVPVITKLDRKRKSDVIDLFGGN
jgi:hypothetical protein